MALAFRDGAGEFRQFVPDIRLARPEQGLDAGEGAAEPAPRADLRQRGRAAPERHHVREEGMVVVDGARQRPARRIDDLDREGIEDPVHVRDHENPCFFRPQGAGDRARERAGGVGREHADASARGEPGGEGLGSRLRETPAGECAGARARHRQRHGAARGVDLQRPRLANSRLRSAPVTGCEAASPASGTWIQKG